jgi:hypothetical protein
LRAHGIPAGDITGTSDAYLTLHAPFLAKSIKTSVKNNVLTSLLTHIIYHALYEYEYEYEYNMCTNDNRH